MSHTHGVVAYAITKHMFKSFTKFELRPIPNFIFTWHVLSTKRKRYI